MQSLSRQRNWVIGIAVALWLGFSLYAYQFTYPQSPNLLPFVPLAVLGLFFAIRHFEGFLFATVFVVPMSVEFLDLGGGIGAALPGEALLLISAGGIFLLILQGKIKIAPLLLHPIGLAILLQMLWTIVTALKSTHGIISTKFILARLIYILVFYVGFGSIFLNHQRIVTFFKAHIWGLVPISIWAIIHLSQFGLSRSFSPVMAEPFYDDHTVFGVCLTMVLPWAGYLVFRDRMPITSTGKRNFAWPVFILLFLSMLLTFSRAAWLSLLVIAGYYALLRFRIKFQYILWALAIVAAIGIYNSDRILDRMQKNENVSGADVLSTAASVTNVSSDDSNKERLNRWACALRMYEERPWTGFGPGTYERNYGSYQILSEVTRISTWDGNRGDAHSEYLGALSEQGIPGLVLLCSLFLLSLATGMRVAYRSPDSQQRALSLVILLSLSAYYFHGFVNDFLDIDKAAILFWASLSMLAALDIRRKSMESQMQSLPQTPGNQ